jgi:choline-sulfatase
MASDRPHVVVLLADQLRRDVLGCYGGRHDASPNIDAVAAESAVLASHVSNCPLCVPVRNTILTGVHAHVHGAIVNAWDEEERPYGICRDRPTLYESLATAGYRVEHVGVNHLRCDPPLQERHERIRFSASAHEHRLGLRRAGREPDMSVCKSPCIDFRGGEPVTRMYTNPNTLVWPGGEEGFLDVWLAERMTELIEQADPSEPLALFGNFWLPHCPLVCPEPYFSMYDPDRVELPDNVGVWCDAHSPMQLANLPGHVAASVTPDGWRRAWAVYLGMVRMLDDCLGRVVEALKARGLWDDSLVVFSSDHGEMLGSHRMFQKMCMYEDSIRPAMLVKPPGGGVMGRREQLTEHLGLAATVCDYTGAEPPAGSAGVSFRPVVEGAAAAGAEAVFAEFNGNSGRGFQQRAVITPDHKYIYNHGYRPELYDLRTDPGETRNLLDSDAPPAVAANLRQRLEHWMSETADPLGSA